MYTEEDLASAVKAGALTEETAAAFRAHVAQLKNESAVDEEHFRLVTGFNDIFVVIACALLLVSVGWIGAAVAPWLGALAMRWDMADRLRQTRKSDVAFWLHLLAAPLIVRPVFAALGVLDGEADLWQAIAVVALYVTIALVSLAIDRRALMVSALIYVLYTFSALLSQYGGVSLSFAITGLTIGSALLLLSAFWHASRAFVLRRLPPAAQERLAPSR
jgi:hypothetical protein